MKRAVIVCALIASACSGSSPTAATPTPAAVPACQSQNTGTVYFQNRSTSGLTYDIIWDGSRLTTVGPGQDSPVFTFAANVTHALRFQFTNTSLLACNAGSPILTTCANTFYSCTG